MCGAEMQEQEPEKEKEKEKKNEESRTRDYLLAKNLSIDWIREMHIFVWNPFDQH